MNKIVTVILLSVLLFSCNKEENGTTDANQFNGELVWSKSFGGSQDEIIHGVTATSDGGFVVVGNTNSSDGDITNKVSLEEDVWLSKYDANGNLIWSKTYGGSLDDLGSSIVENNDGTLVIGAYSKSDDGDVPSNLGMHDFFIFKTDSQGNLIWKESYGFMSHDHAHKIIKSNDGGYLVTGYADYEGISRSSQVLHGVGEFYGLKLNALGEKEWDCYFGGTQNDRVYDVVQANDGGFVMVGYSESNDFDVDDNHGSYDFWVVKVNPLGQLVWKKSFGGDALEQAYGIVKTANNSYIIAGTANSTNGDITGNKGGNDVWLVAIDDTGKKLWQKTYGGTDFETANAIKMLRNGNFVIVGHTTSTNGDVSEGKGFNDVWVFAVTPTGNLLWEKTLGGSSFDFGYDVVELADRSLIVVGDTESNDKDVPQNKGSKDLFIAKIK